MSKSRLNESYGQRPFEISTALLPIYGESPHYIDSSLYKYQIFCCKSVHQSSTRSNIKLINFFEIYSANVRS
ncbi:hypothetical protein EPA86_03445 [Litorilituus lipolyticus]|uniref:Uncharacterized protein n=1 Tax=Litorilituus lipolyticus TaxID=2491017 RepID=A0A502L792_9GAMM|nr:hypothetical protein EPA86_03445 [Litorilituus lipolyticus]